MIIDHDQIQAATERYVARTKQRDRNKRLIREGRPLAADTPERVAKFLAHHGFDAAEIRAVLAARGSLVTGVTTPAETFVPPQTLERILGTKDFLGVYFLERGVAASRTVGRITLRSGGQPAGYGTGFLISPRLLMTNHHVLGNINMTRDSFVEFDYEVLGDGSVGQTTVFDFDVDTCHVADKALDYALVAVQPSSRSGRPLADFGWNRLIEQEGKAVTSQWVNIIQHPQGEVKQLCLRNNQIVDVLDNFIHYEADTSPGSSGSPVYNDRWEVVALHHSGVFAKNGAGQILAIDGQVWRQDMGEARVQWKANEGVRISRVIADMKRKASPAQLQLIEAALAQESTPVRPRQLPPSVIQPGANGHSQPQSGYTATVGHDGVATWTIPLKLSVQLGGTPALVPDALPKVQVASTTSMNGVSKSNGASKGDDSSVVEAARRELGARTDVVGVRLGYVFRDGWITKERALVVTVREKRSETALRKEAISSLPSTYGGLPVEVTTPTMEQLIRLELGPAVTEAAFVPPELNPEEILYHPPEGGDLSAVDEEMRVVAHVSPDSGWTQLGPFLGACKKKLIIGMYDFGAPHIASAVEGLSSKNQMKVKLVMQTGESVGSGTKKDDLTDQEVVDKLSGAFNGRFENAWVKIGIANGWVGHSYHIKVAVRDSSAFWLSSGNWQSSNQPDADPIAENPQKRSWLTKYNREWNAIVEHEGLAKTFEKYLLHDLEENQKLQGDEVLAALPDLLVPETLFAPVAAEATKPFEYFPPFDETRRFKVQPLLTPDNYHARVLKLIRGATQELLLQNQTFNAPLDGQQALIDLLSAILERQQEGVDVRIIFRVLKAADARANLEGLQDFGFDMSKIRLQKNCHTKGIIVDGKRVLIGSQNLSNAGVSVNRDASLLFNDTGLATYFRKIFFHDWSNLAQQNIGNEALSFEVARADTPTPAGKVRLTWKDYMEMQ